MAFKSIKERLGRMKSETLAKSEEDLMSADLPEDVKTEMLEEIQRLKKHSPIRKVIVRDEDYKYSMTIKFVVFRKGGKKSEQKIHRDYPKNSKDS